MKRAFLVAYTALALVGFFWGKAEGVRSVSSSNTISQALRSTVLIEEDGHLKLAYRCGGDVLALQNWKPGSPVILDEEFESPPRSFASMLGGTFGTYFLTAGSGGLAARVDAKRLVKALSKPSKESSRLVMTAVAVAGSGALIGYQVGQRYGVRCDDPKLLAELSRPSFWKIAKLTIAFKLIPGVDRMLSRTFTRAPFVGHDVVTADPRELAHRSRLRMRELLFAGFPNNMSEQDARSRFYARKVAEKPASSAQVPITYAVLALIALTVLALIGGTCFALFKLTIFLYGRFAQDINAT